MLWILVCGKTDCHGYWFSGVCPVYFLFGDILKIHGEIQVGGSVYRICCRCVEAGFLVTWNPSQILHYPCEIGIKLSTQSFKSNHNPLFKSDESCSDYIRVDIPWGSIWFELRIVIWFEDHDIFFNGVAPLTAKNYSRNPLFQWNHNPPFRSNQSRFDLSGFPMGGDLIWMTECDLIWIKDCVDICWRRSRFFFWMCNTTNKPIMIHALFWIDFIWRVMWFEWRIVIWFGWRVAW